MLEKANSIAVEVARRFSSKDVVVFDSLLALQRRYKELCHRYRVRARAGVLWRCFDALHEGTLLYDQYAIWLLNFLVGDDPGARGDPICRDEKAGNKRS